MNNLLKKIASILEVKKITPSDKLSNFNSWDSLAKLSVIALAEKEYKKNLNNDQIEKFKTVQDILHFFLKKK